MEQEQKKEVRFILKVFRAMETKEGRFCFEAKKSIEWEGKNVKFFTFFPKMSEEILKKNVGKAIVIHNAWIVNKGSLTEDGNSWKCLDIGAYDDKNNEIIYGYDEITFEELTWEEKDKKKFLVDGAATVAVFVTVVLIFRGIWNSSKKNRYN